jgi:hypothetical protein
MLEMLSLYLGWEMGCFEAPCGFPQSLYENAGLVP